MNKVDELMRVHGDRICAICGKPKSVRGFFPCNYPHGMLPFKPLNPEHPDGFWSWVYPEELEKELEKHNE